MSLDSYWLKHGNLLKATVTDKCQNPKALLMRKVLAEKLMDRVQFSISTADFLDPRLTLKKKRKKREKREKEKVRLVSV